MTCIYLQLFKNVILLPTTIVQQFFNFGPIKTKNDIVTILFRFGCVVVRM